MGACFAEGGSVGMGNVGGTRGERSVTPSVEVLLQPITALGGIAVQGVRPQMEEREPPADASDNLEPASPEVGVGAG